MEILGKALGHAIGEALAISIVKVVMMFLFILSVVTLFFISILIYWYKKNRKVAYSMVAMFVLILSIAYISKNLFIYFLLILYAMSMFIATIISVLRNVLKKKIKK